MARATWFAKVAKRRWSATVSTRCVRELSTDRTPRTRSSILSGSTASDGQESRQGLIGLVFDLLHVFY